jgi:hypothetical protein
MASKKTKSVKLTDLIAAEIKATAPAPVEPPPAKLVNRIWLLLDDSGSMRNCYQEAVRQLNSNLRNIRSKAKETGQETFISFATFGGGGNVRTHFENRSIDQVGDIDSYFAAGPSTPLIDAIGTAINNGMKGPGSKDPNTSFLVLCITDGGENGSRIYGTSYNPSNLERMISDAQGTDRWTLAVLTPRGNEKEAAQYGIPRANISAWDNTVAGAAEAFTRTAVSFDSFYNARSTGQKSTKSFYTTDLSSLKKADLSKMTDLSGRFKKWTVDREVDITAFVESKGVKFVIGAGYYQFTKKEKLREGRTLVIREKGTNRIFGGKEARAILGIPDGEVQVTPGNHANYDLFMQSTSTNRKLVRGTELYYDLLQQPGQIGETWDSRAAMATAELKKAQQQTQV